MSYFVLEQAMNEVTYKDLFSNLECFNALKTHRRQEYLSKDRITKDLKSQNTNYIQTLRRQIHVKLGCLQHKKF